MRKRPILTAILLFAGGAFLLIIGLGVLYGIYGDEGDYSTTDSKIAIVEVKGIIMDAEKVIKELKKFGRNPKIKAIIIRIESPGGAVAPSQEIFSEIMRVRT